MNVFEIERATAQEIASYARQQGVDLGSLCNDSVFQRSPRWVFFWRKVADVPCTGSDGEQEGTLHYNLQGTIHELPNRLQPPASTFQRTWSEAGTLESVQEAFTLVKRWLLEEKEVDDLPTRKIVRSGMG